MVIFNILRDLGYAVDTDLESYYTYIDEWTDWWKGYFSKFHKYQATDDQGNFITLYRKKLKMAKKVCEDWANLLLNDKTLINVDDDDTQSYLTGDGEEQQSGVLGRSKFWKMGNRLIEREFASGTACFYLDLVRPNVLNGELRADDVKIRYIRDARMIVPLSWENGEITEVALASEQAHKGKRYLYLQLFLIHPKGYLVENYFYEVNDESYKRVDNLNGIVDNYLLPCKPFVVISPNIENNLEDVPMGISIYANAIDQLKGCDLAYDNLYNDILLGKKRVFMNQAMFAMKQASSDPEDKRIKPDIPTTIEKTLYVITGTKTPSDEQFMQEYNPQLRVDENKENIQLNLNILSSKVGFGQHRYQFDAQAMATATEVRTSNKDLTESVWKQRITIQDALTELVHSILILAKEKCGLSVNPDVKISIQFDDTMFSDEETERMRFLQEISAGVRQKWEYRVKYLGEEEEEAREMTGELEGMEPQGLQFPLDQQVNKEDLDA